ncbi:hypothetical protein TIFTF001_032740 [Ficus carica]|uniref:Uncharacterized protein n=1 Tax=Ficus carica TaxID=3494 RepID=A0AA88DX39_FICCA|nr:hypothetical protein TIFTF001_032651 [Ficus carica]GMN63649.1 hypothetical protein TIFTF001_032740 [Ficus carica]
MQETQLLPFTKSLPSPSPSSSTRTHLPTHSHHDFPSLSHPKSLRFPTLSSKTNTPLNPSTPTPTPTPNATTDFQEKLLYLDSIGIDFLSLIHDHPPILSFPLADIKSTVDFVASVGFTAVEFRRIVGMCPEVLSSRVSDIVPIFTFLIREARVNGSDLRRVINRRPRLLACSVKNRLRPTLYFLQSIGISEVNKHTNLLSSSVEEKLVPRIEYFERIGFSKRDSLSMFRRFPQLFCYSVKENFEPKFDYFVVELGRDLKELKEFPQYFSFSLEKRIKPRHQSCVEKGVCFPLPILLKTSNAKFRDRLDICCNASMPFQKSPLWCTNCDIDLV